MKIVYDSQIFSWQRYGGISRYFFEISKRIALKKGVEARIIAPLYVNEYINKTNAAILNGIKIKSFPRSGRVITKINQYITKYVALSGVDVDIFHETYYSYLDCCPRSAKRILTVYDMIHEKFLHNLPGSKKVISEKKLAASRADHIICISKQTQADLIELLEIPTEKTSVVYLGNSLTSKKKKDTPKNQFERPYILYVGERYGHKNFDRLLKVFASSEYLKQQCNLVCFGGGAFNSRELDLIKNLNLDKRVFYISGNDALLESVYSSARVFVYPSLYEGFGIPPLEAMTLGCPVVCSNVSSIPEVVGDAAELFNPNDDSGMGSAIEKVVRSEKYSEYLSMAGKERSKKFDWQKCAEDTLDVYEKVKLD